MENQENAFVASQKRKQRKKRIRNIVLLCIAAVIVAAGVIVLNRVLNAEPESASVLTYSAGSVREGEISTTISGSGTLSALHSETVTSAAAATVETVYHQPGDTVSAGDTILTLASDDLNDKLDALYDELDDTRTQLAGTTQALTNLNVTATKRGIVKDVQAAAGDAAEDLEYLCLISTDGKMKLTIEAPEGLKKYDAVLVSVAGAEAAEGSVTELSGSVATIVFEDDGYSVGADAVVYDETGATMLGSGTITVNEHVRITAAAGRIESIKYAVENQSVSKGTVLFTLASGAPTSAYLTLKETEADLLSQIDDLKDQLTIRAEWDCLLASLPVAVGDEVSAGATLCVLSGTDGYTMTLSIDELDIGTVAIGQDATITLDALEGEYAGKVTNISYAGSGSYVTSYTVTVTSDPIEGALPGMSASIEIVTETSGSSLIVSVDAVQYEGDKAFVYLADGDDVQAGATRTESEMDLDSLNKLYVETGMSNGSYIAITADGLSAGELIWVPTLTTTAVYSSSEDTSVTFGSMGGFSGSDSMTGGSMPSGGFSGGSMPSGGGPGGDRSGS